jgi:hypothetical protein
VSIAEKKHTCELKSVKVKIVCAKLEAKIAKFPVTLLVCVHSTPFSLRCKTISSQARYGTFEFAVSPSGN